MFCAGWVRSIRRIVAVVIGCKYNRFQNNQTVFFESNMHDLVDSVTEKYAQPPINNHIPFTPLTIYFDNSYLPNNYIFHLRRLCFQKDAIKYIKNKYNWSDHASADIDWESHVKNIIKPSNHSYQVKLKFVHHLLSSGEKIT